MINWVFSLVKVDWSLCWILRSLLELGCTLILDNLLYLFLSKRFMSRLINILDSDDFWSRKALLDFLRHLHLLSFAQYIAWISAILHHILHRSYSLVPVNNFPLSISSCCTYELISSIQWSITFSLNLKNISTTHAFL